MQNLIALAVLIVIVVLVIGRLPKIELGHTNAFRRRRALNWVPLGLLYAFLYMGRYNIKVSQSAFERIPDALGNPLMASADFSTIFGIGTAAYAVSFVINGPLTDRVGGRRAILVSGTGAVLANLLMGLCAWSLTAQGAYHELIAKHFVVLYSVLYSINMYFQSFGAVAIVKANAPWFHVRERGVFGAVFGILISLGIYFAYDWGRHIREELGLGPLFIVPAGLLCVACVAVFFFSRNQPSEAGHEDFDTADASSGDDGPRLGAFTVIKMMLRNPIILTIAGIEFCSGFLRQAIMQWYPTFSEHTDSALGLESSFVSENWGLLLCVAGITGAMLAGIISDRVFQSRRGPVAAILYGTMLVGGAVLAGLFTTPAVGWITIAMSTAVIGVHGMLSGTASMDFGGRRNAGTAVGIIDGFVYLGTATMSATYYFVLPAQELSETGEVVGPSTDPANWLAWPLAMVPVALIGLLLALRVWNATPQRKASQVVPSK